MNDSLKLKSTTFYVDSNSKSAVINLSHKLDSLFANINLKTQPIIILCIGSDLATGDSLGPLIGYKLKSLPLSENIKVFGTLKNPINAKNLSQALNFFNNNYKKSIIIAIDASLGLISQIGKISVGKGKIKPGAGLKKNLPMVGDFFITGVVNYCGISNVEILQNTRLSLVMNMADIITSSLWISLSLN